MSLKCFFLFAYIVLTQCRIHDSNPKEDLPCSLGSRDNIYSFTLGTALPDEGRRISQIYIQFNATRRFPFTSTVLLGPLNLLKKIDRQDNFRMYPCNELWMNQSNCAKSYRMSKEQKKLMLNAGATMTSFDRGHLSPSQPFLFDKEANGNTFYCVNIAVQDPFTNQRPWRQVEHVALEFFRERSGFSLTGISDSDSPVGLTEAGYSVPSHYFKMLCYIDDNSETQVVGFIGKNDLVPFPRSGGQQAHKAVQAERYNSTTYPRSQTDVLGLVNLSNQYLIAEAWNAAETFLLKNRDDITALPTAKDCIGKMDIDDTVVGQWIKLLHA